MLSRNNVKKEMRGKTISDLSPQDLNRLLRQAWTGFYLRPKTIGRIGVDAWKSGSLPELFRMGKALMRWSVDSRLPR